MVDEVDRAPVDGVCGVDVPLVVVESDALLCNEEYPALEDAIVVDITVDELVATKDAVEVATAAVLVVESSPLDVNDNGEEISEEVTVEEAAWVPNVKLDVV